MTSLFRLICLAAVILLAFVLLESIFGQKLVAAAPSSSCIAQTVRNCLRFSASQVGSDEQELAEKYSPIAMVKRQAHPCDRNGEAFLPAPVEVVFDDPRVELVKVTGRSRSSVELFKTAPSIADLAGEDDTYHLDFPGNPRRPGCGYEQWFKERMLGHQPVTYANVVTGKDEVIVQYWFWYVFNDFNNTHEGDWEMVQVVFDADSVAEALSKDPVEVGYSQHAGGERSSWTDKKLGKEGTHPIVYVAAGSHASNYRSEVFLAWGENNTGFGCDITTGPSDRIDPMVIRLPHDITQATGSIAWLKWPGRWGERQPAFYNGPEGPGVRTRWTDPFSWQSRLRDNSLEVPDALTFGPGPTSVFCTTVRYSSFLLTRFAVYPWLVIGFLTGLCIAVICLLWFGWPLLRDGLRVYFAHWRPFALIGLLLIPIGLIANSLLFLFIDYPPGDRIFEILDSSPGARLAIALTIGGIQEIVSLIIVGPAVVACMAEIDSNHVPSFIGAYKRVFRRFRPLLRALVRSTVAIAALALSVVGIPWAVDRAVRWFFLTQAVIIDNKDAHDALAMSSTVVKGRWARTALTAIFFWFVGIVPGPLVGIAVLVLFTPGIRYVNWLSSIIYAVMVPISVIGVTLVYRRFKGEPKREESTAIDHRPLNTDEGRLATSCRCW